MGMDNLNASLWPFIEAQLEQNPNVRSATHQEHDTYHESNKTMDHNPVNNDLDHRATF